MKRTWRGIFGDVCILVGLPLVLLVGGVLLMLDWRVGRNGSQ